MADLLSQVKGGETAEVKAKSKGASYAAKKKAADLEAANTLKAAFTRLGVADKLNEAEKAALDRLTKTGSVGRHAIGGKPILYKMFGDAPAKGARITAADMFLKTGKGFSDIRQHIKKWNEKGIVVKFDEAAKVFILDSDVPAYTEA